MAAGFAIPREGTRARDLLGGRDLTQLAEMFAPKNRKKIPCSCTAIANALDYLDKDSRVVSVASICYAEKYNSFILISVDRDGNVEEVWNFERGK